MLTMLPPLRMADGISELFRLLALLDSASSLFLLMDKDSCAKNS